METIAPTDQIYKGQFILFEGQPHNIIEKEFVSPGKGSAFTRVKMNNLETGKLISFTFKSGERVDEIEVNIVEYQYLYADGNSYNFMNNETFEQISLGKDLIGEFIQFLKEGENYLIVVYDNRPIGLKAPLKIQREVIDTKDAIKGNTSNTATKKATVEGGYELDVPLFIKVGDRISINTESGKYVERAN
ncbi:elongation factor P [Candidatus Dojkabacteria bacterium]|nr:elongation factor P [Candidatus Dojkabacteria bacterium]